MAAVRVAIAGSSGSIGTQTLDVVRAEGAPTRGRARVGLVGRRRGRTGARVPPGRRGRLRSRRPRRASPSSSRPVSSDRTWSTDLAALVERADVVVNGVVGFAGLPVTVATLRAGTRLALANKESLIAAGPVVQPLRATPGAELVPVDSEHCAVHQCLRSTVDAAREVARLVLTASGGPFRGRTASELADVTVDEALAHPTWSMGPKITVDSSTLMNKGLEVIEAHELFGTPYDRIDVVVHPQSVVHSMVEFTDGSTIAQLSMPDMRLPIGYALALPAPDRHPFGRIDWSKLRRSTSSRPTRPRSAASDSPTTAGRSGGTAPAWLSAANEVAVDAFLGGRIRWNQIADVCVAVIERHDGAVPASIDDVIAADTDARRVARRALEDLPT
jgi:1-deoxy-D-xylulose-5-phosphate reductoisomerase